MIDDETVAKYRNMIDAIIDKYEPVPKGLDSKGPAEIDSFLFLGDFGDAMNIGQLRELGVTHLLNCAGMDSKVMNNIMSAFSNCDSSGNKHYKQLEADDDEDYDMIKHYNEACEYIDEARQAGGKAMVYCVRGINRSAAICVSYLVVRENMDLCTAVNTVALSRGQVLSNGSFKEQLIKFASEHNKLK